MNTNITALQTIVEALEKNDYITNVSPVRKDGEIIGYTISFAYSDTITIYHGENGRDGADGKDGYTPQIGVMKDTDGIYYWALDGEWLLDGKGNKIQANGVNGTDGTNGNNGQDGTNGVDGITPRLKIENDYWYVSYDDGVTWIELGKATGEDGSNGIDGADGDSIFSSVTQDDEYVYFNLADGTMITLPKHDNENIQFEDLQVKAICCKNWDTNYDGELSYSEAAAVTDIGTIFRENTNIIAFTELKYFIGLTNVSEYAFSGCKNLWKIELPQYITNIASYAFASCNSIRYINIPDSVTTIGERAFYGCSSLKSLTIPDSVTTIGDSAFYGCKGELEVNCNIPSASSSDYGTFYGSKFTTVTIGDSVTTIGSYAFEGCSSLTSVTIGNSVTTIGDYAFCGCSSLTSVTIPDSVTSIGSSAFSGCSSLTSVTIPDSVTTIGSSAFYNCSSQQVYIADLSAWCKIDFANSSANPLYYDNNLYLNNELVTDLVIPSDITEIKSYAFYYCSSLTSVTIPDSVTSIGSSAFSGCSRLTSVTIPDSVTTIGDQAFRNCSSLTSITIPDSVTSIGSYAFESCSSLTSVYCKATTPPTVSYHMFRGNASGRKIYVPIESVQAYKSASYWNDYKSSIVGYDF